MRRAAVALLLVALLGCENRAAPESIPNGVTQITKNMRGIWKSEGGPSCRWWISTSDGRGGTTTHDGNLIARKKKLKSASQSQTVVIGSGNVGNKDRRIPLQYFHSDKCGKGWTQ